MVDPAVSIFTHRGRSVSKVDVGFKLWPVDWVTAHITTAGWLEGGRRKGGRRRRRRRGEEEERDRKEERGHGSEFYNTIIYTVNMITQHLVFLKI